MLSQLVVRRCRETLNIPPVNELEEIVSERHLQQRDSHLNDEEHRAQSQKE